MSDSLTPDSAATPQPPPQAPPLRQPNRVRRLHDPEFRGFASDNYSGVLPEVMEALALANGGHQRAYGADVYTAALGDLVRQEFGELAEIYPVFNGTGANVVALDLLTQRWSSVVCARSAHINVDECGAPEKISGTKLLPVDTPDGKLTPELIDTVAWGFGDEHHAQPAVVSVTQSTELGTLYTPQELAAICEHAHGLGMWVHLDGARLPNAAAALDVPLRAVTTDVGVDVLSFGGTKNGLMGAEAVIVLNPEAVSRPLFVRKLDAQLSSKMRFVSVQLLALLTGQTWRRPASHANAMARELAEAVREVPGVQLTREPQSNAVFAVVPPAVTAALQERFPFYVWDEATDEVRWMCSFDTTSTDISRFVQALREELQRA
ncbi:threonine aldolase family protein [Gephyromycinifex aptenodytis]|uniref:threonine aldolase family protein n=1 Tax=Gephyromycinifex aptenodytis TaxID=2716227 RepID=UPI001D008A1F|nr:low specificity L-threonine aldolase [Gephyromycinifex aptenodytis]